jgi:L,D-peptidoglycan transpeptidase YkuD (ErfK/YbiS/YcfS/YnhG family)
MMTIIQQINVRGLSCQHTGGILTLGSMTVKCALGRSGRRTRKREGDGATPIGRWCLMAVFYRADRVARPVTKLPVKVLHPGSGWCDAAGDRNYNRPVRHPYAASAERMWRDDPLYDLVVVTNHNQRPRVQGGGSAIFMHIARDGYLPTEGCIALSERDLRTVLRHASKDTVLDIRA